MQADGGRVLAPLLKLAGWLLVMAVLGVALGAVQLIPLVELLPLNFRAGSASLEQVRGWAWPARHVLTFLLPNVFGSPSHHQYFDLWTRQWTPATVNALGESSQTIFWGIKNYVEGANYLGVATWLLAADSPSGGQCGGACPGPRASWSGCWPAWRGSRCSLRSARRSTRCSTTACPAGTSFTARSAGCSPSR